MHDKTLLKGLTWDHPRAYAGLEAETRRFECTHPGIVIQWERQSLRGFEAASIQDSAAEYDLVILDHPFMGDAAASGCFLDLNKLVDLAEPLATDQFVGKSLESYWYGGAQWALPIDGACQTAVWRPDLLDAPPQSLDEVMALASADKVGLAMACPHAFMNFLTICGLLGSDISGSGDQLVERKVAEEALRILRDLSRHLPLQAFDWSSIGLLEEMSIGELVAYCPMVFCFSPYSRLPNGNRKRLRFSELPIIDQRQGCVGSVIGGAGLAVSTSCVNRNAAEKFLRHICDPAAQARMALDGGQPAATQVWFDLELDKANCCFFSSCRPTMEGAIIRPRYSGYMELQNRAGELLRLDCLERSAPVRDVVDQIDAFFRRSKCLT